MLIKFSQSNLKSLALVSMATCGFNLGLNLANVSLAQAPNLENQLQNQSLTEQLPSNWNFKPPGGIGTPDNTEAGGTRGDSSCLTSDQSLILLVPPNNLNYTTNAYPSFAWYMPPNSASAVKFTLYDQNYQELYTVESSLPQSPEQSKSGQIMSLSLPDSIGLQPLAINQQYPWEISLICDQVYRLDNVKAESIIERLPLSSSLENSLEGANLEQQIILYANADPYPFWSDTLTSLMNLRRLEPNNQEVEEAWDKLLRSANLDQVISHN